MMVSIKTRKYHIREIIYDLYQDNIFQNKKEIKFISVSASSFIKYTENFGHCMEFINAEVNPDHIKRLKKPLDKAELNNVVMILMNSFSQLYLGTIISKGTQREVIGATKFSFEIGCIQTELK